MRVLLASIYDTSRTGGLSTHVAELSGGLRKAGHDACIATPYTVVPSWRRRLVQDLPRLPWRLVDRDGAFVHYLSVGRRYLASGIKHALSVRSAEVIHAHDPTALLAARDALGASVPGGRGTPRGDEAPGPRLVLTVHGDIANLAESDGAIHPVGRGRRTAEAIEAEAYRVADVLITVDGRLRRHCLSLGGERAIEVFANFVDVDRFRPPGQEDAVALAELRRRLELPDSTRVLLCPRRLVPKTGVMFAIRALAEPGLAVAISRHSDRVVLLVAGQGAQRPALEAEARRLGLDTNAGGTACVRFLGDVPRDELLLLYRLADVVLVPSVPDAGVIEATSLTALEAMASGKTVIASAIGGLAELIESGRTGVLVPAGDAPALASAIARALTSAPFVAAIGAAARAYVEGERSTSACVARVLTLYGRPKGASHARGGLS